LASPASALSLAPKADGALSLLRGPAFLRRASAMDIVARLQGGPQPADGGGTPTAGSGDVAAPFTAPVGSPVDGAFGGVADVEVAEDEVDPNIVCPGPATGVSSKLSYQARAGVTAVTADRRRSDSLLRSAESHAHQVDLTGVDLTREATRLTPRAQDWRRVLCYPSSWTGSPGVIDYTPTLT